MPKPDISNAFANAGQSQKIHALNQRVEELEAEINQLRARESDDKEKADLELRIKELVAELSEKQGIEEIAINLIDRNPRQPRQTFTKASIQGMAESLKTQGQHTPIILISLPNSRYLLFDGERRWRAAQQLGWKTLTSVFIHFDQDSNKLDHKTIHKQALSTTLHREDLNALDLAESLIEQIIYEYPYLEEEKEAIPRILNAAMSRLERNRKNLELANIRLSPKEVQKEWLETAGFKSLEEENIFDVILELQLNPTSIDTNIFPLLKLPHDLKFVIRQEGLEGSKARELSKLSADQLNLDEDKAKAVRDEVIQKVIQEKLSLNQIKALVKETLKQYKSSETSNNQKRKIEKTISTIQSISFQGIQHSQIEEIRQALLGKLKEIEQLISDTVVDG